MAEKFDLVAIGTGSGASAVAHRCRSAGWKVAIVDSRPFGGTCALRGCDPKKVLVGAADAVDWARRMEGKGIRGDARIDWPELMRFKRSLIEGVPKNREEGLARDGIAAFHGRGRFVGPTSVRVGETLLEARHVVVAAGMKPADLKIPGTEHLTTSDQFLELDELPRRVAFVGGGYISFEFAHVAARAGAEVTILHRGQRPLPRFDPDLVDLLVERTRKLGVRVELRTAVRGIERTADGLAVHARTAADEERLLQADMVVHGAGRVPEIDDMDLAAAGVGWDERGVKVNEYLQSVSNPAVYAAGDAAASGGPPLTPVAGYEGRIVAANLLNRNKTTADYKGIPSVAFTVPPLAAVGLQEATARQQGLRFRVHKEKTSGWYSSRRIAEEYSGFTVLIEEDTERVLGAHLLGPHAEDTINLFALAIRSGLPARDLKQTIFAYPTHASDVGYML
jgi:glutathione reductase (NADPH)